MTLPTLPYGTPLQGADAGLWAVAICRQLKAPVTLDNCYSLAGWFAREGGGGQNNPMNTTLGSEYPAINSDGVRNYPTPTVGVTETVATLTSWYPAIVGAFRAGLGLAYPGVTAAAELHEWSGGGYDAITPVTVPMPPAPATHHYAWFDSTVEKLPTSRNSERLVVENYDKQRAHPAVNKLSLQRIALNLAQLVTNVENVMRAQDPKGVRFHRAWRLDQLRARANGQVVKPEPGTWPRS